MAESKHRVAQMFLLAHRGGEEDKLYYWSGDQIWSVHLEDAVWFLTRAEADATIDVIKRVFPKLAPTVHVVSLPESIE